MKLDAAGADREQVEIAVAIDVEQRDASGERVGDGAAAVAEIAGCESPSEGRFDQTAGRRRRRRVDGTARERHVRNRPIHEIRFRAGRCHSFGIAALLEVIRREDGPIPAGPQRLRVLHCLPAVQLGGVRIIGGWARFRRDVVRSVR